MNGKIKVMLSTEGTYPFHHGGVSTWCDILVNNLRTDIDFTLYSIIMNPFVTQKFNLPENTKLIKVPLWGTEEPSEHLEVPFSKIYIAKKKTTDDVISNYFAPLFKDMMKEIMNYEKNPKQFGQTIHDLYLYFQEYDYKKSFKSEITWEIYKAHVQNLLGNNMDNIQTPGIYSIIQSLGWIYRFMTVLNTPVPEIDVTHSAAAAFCGIPCVLAKMQYNAPFILTEHGVYLREQYLSLSKRGYPSFLNTFLIRLIHSVVSLNYFYADQISPVCEYNTRWEDRFGAEHNKIQVIYNGVNQNILVPNFKLEKNKFPTVVSVARIDPVKDILTLLKSAAIVKREIPNVRFIVYGSVTVPEYYKECLELKEELGLSESFIFAGHTNDIPSAYHSGDVIALSSITEGFPYSVVEAMMSGKAVIATDVGGIKEAMGENGILVPPRNAEELSKGIIKLLKDKSLRDLLGEEARQRALNHFTISNVKELYYNSYVKLKYLSQYQATAHKTEDYGVIRFSAKEQILYIEKGEALFQCGFYQEAIMQLRMAIRLNPKSPAVPVVLMKIAEAYNFLGDYDKASAEVKKAEILINLLSQPFTA